MRRHDDGAALPMPDWSIVTGSSGAIGSAVCNRLAAAGVAIAGLDLTPWDRSPQNLAPGPVDLRDLTALRAMLRPMLDVLGPPRYVVHVAGIYPLRSLEELDDDGAQNVMAVNYLSAVELCRLVVPPAVTAGGARIVLVTSQAGVTGGTDAAYAASKAALTVFGKSLAREYGSTGLRVNMLSPGPVESEMAAVMPTHRRTYYENAIPIKRFTRAEEVAELAEYLLLRAPDALHGATIDIDGGLVRR